MRIVCGEEMVKRDYVYKLLRHKEIVEAVEQASAENVTVAENRDTVLGDLPEIYKLIGNVR